MPCFSPDNNLVHEMNTRVIGKTLSVGIESTSNDPRCLKCVRKRRKRVGMAVVLEQRILVLGHHPESIQDVCDAVNASRPDVVAESMSCKQAEACSTPPVCVVVCADEPDALNSLGVPELMAKWLGIRVIGIGFDGVALSSEPAVFAVIRACESTRQQAIDAATTLAISTLPVSSNVGPLRFHATVCAIRDLVREWNDRLDNQRAA